jgi:hypothetical protein
VKGCGRAVRNYGPALVARWTAPPCRFVIVTGGRTGSELLVSLLDSHPEILCHGELLAEHRLFPTSFIAARDAMAGLRGANAHGWKLLYSQFHDVPGFGDSEQYLSRLHERGYRIILLERQNFLHQAISWLQADQRATFHYRPTDGAEFSPLPLDPVHLLAATFWCEAAANSLRQATSQVPHLAISYEDDLTDQRRQRATIDRVCHYLELPSAATGTNLIKITPRNTSSMLSNFEEVAEVLQATRYAHFIADEPSQYAKNSADIDTGEVPAS